MPRLVLALLFFSLFLLSLSSIARSKAPSVAADDDIDEDLSFLEQDDDKPTYSSDPEDSDDEADNYGDDFGSYNDSDSDDEEVFLADEKDVVVLRERNFTDVIEENKYVMVEFYAPWCGHCQALAPEYAAAATQLKDDGVDVVLAKVDATKEHQLARHYDVQGFPTILFFVDGEHKPYNGQRTKEAIVTWIKKKTGPGIYNITTTEEAEKILTSESRVVLAYLNSLTSPESEELAAASKLEDDVNFYQTTEPNVAKLFDIDAETKRPALVLLKKEAEKISYFDGQFAKSVINDFVAANKLPLVTTFTKESSASVFESQIKKQLLLFATAKGSDKVLPIFQEAAKLFKGKILFVYVQVDDEDTGKPVAEYFGVTGDAPKMLAYSGNEDGKKYILDGEVTLDKIKAFGEGFLEGKLKPVYKSDPIPESNDGDVKIVVGDNFDEIVLDESKDVLLEIYAPWCVHCQALEPTYSKLAKHLRGVNSIVIAKMDGTTNEHPRAKSEGFPTLLFFPAGNKSSDLVTVDTDRTVAALYKFLKKHASIPFKLKKQISTTKGDGSETEDSSEKIDAEDLKDEL
uniref:Protein disulfide-isomerase n=1 Tax=Opuntia streptacantha TaxID=393608 RepID=A0A7C9EU26_OPUST